MEKNVMRSMETVAKERMEVAVSSELLCTALLCTALHCTALPIVYYANIG